MTSTYAFNKKSSLSKLKVSSYTQVEPELVGTQTRSIVGQEDMTEDSNISKHSEPDLSVAKQSKGVRPPLVGQASSSSNDSVSLSFESKTPDIEKENSGPRYQPGIVESYVETVNVDAGLSGINFTRGSYNSTSYVGMLNREEYINQRPPEGSSEQISGTTQPLENIQDFPRIRSPSSASSVTSTKPLEWDSGADVGYNQINTHTGLNLNPGMSTIERMALACRTNLLARSDPEGTTGSSGQQQPKFNPTVQTKLSLKNKLGSPKAKSTPVCTSGPSDASPETVSGGLISPILNSVSRNSNNVTSISSSNSCDSDQNKKGESNASTNGSIGFNKKSKIPLFPEIIESLPKLAERKGKVFDESDSKYGSLSDSDKRSSEPSDSQMSKKKKDYNVTGILDMEPKSQVLSLEKTSNFNLSLSSKSLSNKKLSSSLENISTIVEPENVKHPNSLPRSQSQLNLQIENLGQEVTDSVISSNGPKYNMALHNLLQNNKSASSSSIATVVHRKGSSPKHKFAQTSAFTQESVGVQVSQCWAGGDFTELKTGSDIHLKETPHLPKEKNTVSTYPKRSNYFDNPNSYQNPRDELVLLYQRSNPNEENKLKNECLSHAHSGIVCTGALRKVPATNACKIQVKTEQNPCFASGDVLRLNSNLENRPVTQGSANENSRLAGPFGTGTLESVESSTKSGGGWVDKQYSVTVEDRVNSFEYLPGHIYESTERQNPVDSRGTSSISIQNQTSNNDTDDPRTKSWNSSASSDLEKDVQRGVEMISDFVKGSCANDLMMKEKLIRRVVEKLITKNYTEDSVRPEHLTNNVPWVPKRPPNPVERNGRETRRSLSRSKVPCEFSSRSEKSGSTNASSECFIPRPQASSTFLPNSFKEVSGGQGKQSHSSTSEISLEKSSKVHGKPTNTMEQKTQVMRKTSLHINQSEESCKSSDRGDWREPATRSEKIIEERRKMINKSEKTGDSSSEQSEGATLVHYLNMERDNQLFWIRSEIQHLSNLKDLLEKQAELKRGLKGIKVKKNKSSPKLVLRDRNSDRDNVNVEESKGPKSQTTGEKEKPRYQKNQERRPTLGVWLEESLTGAKENHSAHSDTVTEGWASHRYNDENKANLKSCMKRRNKQTMRVERKVQSIENLESEIYDQVEGYSFGRPARGESKHRAPPTPHWPSAVTRSVDSTFVTTGGLTKSNAHKEMLQTVGVQTTDSVQQLPIANLSCFNKRHRCRCACRGNCECRASAKEQQDKKPPVGYFITFEPSPSDCRTEPAGASRSLEEVRIPIPMSEPKQKKNRRRAEEEERLTIRSRDPVEVHDRDRWEENRERAGADCLRRESETESNSQESGILPSGPMYKGATGQLQYCLLRNRPDYVSRAEDRRRCVAQMQYLRELREHSKRRLLSLTALPAPAPPPHAQAVPCMRRVFSQQTMRRQTEKKYRKLAEVQKRQQDTKRKEGYRTNRLMAEIFNKKLQKRVLKGETDLSNSVTVLSSI